MEYLGVKSVRVYEYLGEGTCRMRRVQGGRSLDLEAVPSFAELSMLLMLLLLLLLHGSICSMSSSAPCQQAQRSSVAPGAGSQAGAPGAVVRYLRLAVTALQLQVPGSLPSRTSGKVGDGKVPLRLYLPRVSSGTRTCNGREGSRFSPSWLSTLWLPYLGAALAKTSNSEPTLLNPLLRLSSSSPSSSLILSDSHFHLRLICVAVFSSLPSTSLDPLRLSVCPPAPASVLVQLAIAANHALQGAA